MSSKTCADCQYFAGFKVKAGSNPYKVDVNQYRLGFCHRYPPSALEYRPNSVPPVVAAFPAVTPEDWCGEFKPGPGRPATAHATAPVKTPAKTPAKRHAKEPVKTPTPKAPAEELDDDPFDDAASPVEL